MAVHELGHIVATYATGGTVIDVVLEPLSISHTEYGELPYPGIVVWAGPIIGSLLPLAAIPAGKIGQFFAGFCLVANGAYIGLGSVPSIGDCALMLLTGTPKWAMWIFGLVTVPSGLYLWHRLGSLADFWKWQMGSRATCFAAGLLTAVVAVLAALAIW